MGGGGKTPAGFSLSEKPASSWREEEKDPHMRQPEGFKPVKGREGAQQASGSEREGRGPHRRKERRNFGEKAGLWGKKMLSDTRGRKGGCALNQGKG